MVSGEGCARRPSIGVGGGAAAMAALAGAAPHLESEERRGRWRRGRGDEGETIRARCGNRGPGRIFY
jgi:hypothetical protein